MLLLGSKFGIIHSDLRKFKISPQIQFIQLMKKIVYSDMTQSKLTLLYVKKVLNPEDWDMSMTADVLRTILYGGIFPYPKDSKSSKGNSEFYIKFFLWVLLWKNLTELLLMNIKDV